MSTSHQDGFDCLYVMMMMMMKKVVIKVVCECFIWRASLSADRLKFQPHYRQNCSCSFIRLYWTESNLSDGVIPAHTHTHTHTCLCFTSAGSHFAQLMLFNSAYSIKTSHNYSDGLPHRINSTRENTRLRHVLCLFCGGEICTRSKTKSRVMHFKHRWFEAKMMAVKEKSEKDRQTERKGVARATWSQSWRVSALSSGRSLKLCTDRYLPFTCNFTRTDDVYYSCTAVQDTWQNK